MPDFRYIARELSGRQVTGMLSAATEQDALSTLSARSLFPVCVDLADAAGLERGRSGRRVAARHLTAFYSQMADLLKSGVPLLRSLQLFVDQNTQPALKYVVQDVAERVADGSRLAESMRHHPRVFSDLAVSMIRAGEEGSFLEDVLKRIARYNEHQDDLTARVIGAVVYPIFLLVVGLMIVISMLVFFVPQFARIFSEMAKADQLPWATTSLLSISAFFQSHWPILVLLCGGLILGIMKYRRTEDGR